MEFVALFIIILVIGALAGGKYFGDIIRKGCLWTVILVTVLIVGLVVMLDNGQ